MARTDSARTDSERRRPKAGGALVRLKGAHGVGIAKAKAEARRPEPAYPAEAVRDQMHRAISLILVSACALLVIGIVMVYSATAPAAIRNARINGEALAFTTANGQLMYAAIGLAVGAVAVFLPAGVFLRAANWIFAAGIALQCAVVTPLGKDVAGNLNWLKIGPFTIQPSEFLKFATIVWIAAQLGRSRTNDWGIHSFFMPSWGILPERWRGAHRLPVAAGAALALAAVLLGFDMGTAMVFALICAGIFWLAGMPSHYYVAGGALAGFGAAVLVAMSPSRLTRIKEYLANLASLPDSTDPTQSDFALWAFGSGGLSGRGLGTGIEKWPGNLAEAQNDFIFAVIGEELGLFGCLVVVAMFFVLGFGLMKIATYHPSRFARLACGGIAVWMCGQAMANMLVVTGVFPVFGVPLPLISQGGSAVIACLLAVGFAVSCALSAPGVRESFRVRGRLAHRVRAVVKG